MKNRIEELAEKSMTNEVLETANISAYLMVEFITKLLLVAEKNVILVICNRLSKIAYLDC